MSIERPAIEMNPYPNTLPPEARKIIAEVTTRLCAGGQETDDVTALFTAFWVCAARVTVVEFAATLIEHGFDLNVTWHPESL